MALRKQLLAQKSRNGSTGVGQGRAGDCAENVCGVRRKRVTDRGLRSDSFLSGGKRGSFP